MTDRELRRAVEECSLSELGHRDHVRLGWIYLRELPVPEALATISSRLRAFAASKGHPEVYHETVTYAFMFLIRERMERTAGDADWEQFAADHPDLFERSPGVLGRYYRPETLDSELSRRVFVLPDATPSA